MQKKKYSSRKDVNYKIKISNAVRTFLLVLFIAVFALGSGNLIKNLTNKTEIISENKELYTYTNHFTSNSKINLKSNEYVLEKDVTDDQIYLSDLISDIDMNLNYKYTDSKPTEVKYNYKIEVLLKAIYSNTRVSEDVLNKVDIIKEETNKVASSKDLSISENINIDYAKYHQMMKDFKQQLGISAESYLYVILTVNTKANIGDEEVENEYVANYKIGIGDKVALIDEKNKDEKTDSVKVDWQRERSIDLNYRDIALSSIAMIISFVLFIVVLKRTEKLNTIKNKYKLELNRILRSCENKLVQIEDLKQIDVEHATRVKDMQQLLILAEESLVPIYCYIQEEPEEEAYFIVTKYEKSYIFILR